MTNVTLLDKARRGRVTAIASLGGDQNRSDNVVSIFDSAFDAPRSRSETPAPTNVVEFRSHRTATATPGRLAA